MVLRRLPRFAPLVSVMAGIAYRDICADPGAGTGRGQKMNGG